MAALAALALHHVLAPQEVMHFPAALPAIQGHRITMIATAAHMQELLIQIHHAALYAAPLTILTHALTMMFIGTIHAEP